MACGMRKESLAVTPAPERRYPQVRTHHDAGAVLVQPDHDDGVRRMSCMAVVVALVVHGCMQLH